MFSLLNTMIWSNCGGYCTLKQETTPLWEKFTATLKTCFHYWALWFDQILVDTAQRGQKPHPSEDSLQYFVFSLLSTVIWSNSAGCCTFRSETTPLWGQVYWNSKIISLLLNCLTWSVWWTLHTEVRNHTPLDHLQKQKARMRPLYPEAALTSLTIFVLSMMASLGTFVAPICWVMPPASPSWTLVRRNWNRQEAQCQRTFKYQVTNMVQPRNQNASLFKKNTKLNFVFLM